MARVWNAAVYYDGCSDKDSIAINLCVYDSIYSTGFINSHGFQPVEIALPGYFKPANGINFEDLTSCRLLAPVLS